MVIGFVRRQRKEERWDGQVARRFGLHREPTDGRHPLPQDRRRRRWLGTGSTGNRSITSCNGPRIIIIITIILIQHRRPTRRSSRSRRWKEERQGAPGSGTGRRCSSYHGEVSSSRHKMCLDGSWNAGMTKGRNQHSKMSQNYQFGEYT